MVNKKFLILAVILGLITTLAVNLYIKKQVKNVKEDIPQFPVVVAAINIKSRDVIVEQMVSLKYLPKEYILPDAVTVTKDAIGKVNSSVLIPGEQLLKSKIKEKGSSLGLSFKIPPNKRAVSVRVASDAGIAGLIQPGDLVDVLVTFEGLAGDAGGPQTRTITVLQQVEILAIDQTTEFVGDEKDKSSGYSGNAVVTFALSLDEAERLTLANEKGRLSLALRSFNDKENVYSRGANLSEVISAGTGGSSRISTRSTEDVARLLNSSNQPVYKQLRKPASKPVSLKDSNKKKYKVEVIKGTQQNVVIWDNP
ncbi:MAG: Flp pilus assembly protein CpaB [Candidatus Margulisiibacteriota bacterium]|nr:MAG: Flp pilus assembly protein CpaB [Candidatus Margulisbacteria bacterium GWD2_39_127]OGI01190.1 MAG: Flp pilus assembly protein CpaB [Candidatus Margulisbacteria bacterium GWF2_38_17]OGI09825.1 MAG: Flp pilus assembly protein CpaB [Candidatus Margulisbacteria bacterium GWE2_39_32]PZM78414.1 MAG: Flp pilus assembly protein CpaB [Candidatus Margulisiibacteriota bacterium]HAR62385.1 Flp pilus assembly protein CpaB [Candidatus Margulisiibacteriota bacterium]